jgi:hypothetical protein
VVELSSQQEAFTSATALKEHVLHTPAFNGRATAARERKAAHPHRLQEGM